MLILHQQGLRAGGIPNFLKVVDATRAGLGAQKHYRINEATGTFADRFGAAAGVEAGALTRETGPLVEDDVLGGSVGGKIGPYINIPDLLPYADSFTVGVKVLLDKVPAVKFVIMSSSDGAVGAYSVEVMADRSLRTWSRHEAGAGGTVIEKRTAANEVPLGVPVWIGFSRSVDGTQRSWVGIKKFQSPGAGEAGADATFQVDTLDPTAVDTTNPGSTWRAPPAGDHAVGAYSGGLDPWSGLLAEVIAWSLAIPTADMESVAAEALPNQVWLGPSKDFGEVEVDTGEVNSFADVVHPETGYTVVVDSPPSPVNATVEESGLDLLITGGPSPATDETFTWHVTAGAASSTLATGTVDTVAAAAPVDSTPIGSGEVVQGRAAGATPTGSGENVEGRASGATPIGSGENVEGRA